jgi:acyl carrier protein
MQQDIYDFVLSSLATNCQIDPKHITPATDLFTDLGIDSFGILTVAYSIEDRFGIQMPVGEWMSEVNVGDKTATDLFRIDNFVAAIARLVHEARQT